ncbi:MAG: TonB-dependent receptor, partial [Candidatus Eisenbacteria sp.]|nr:TonB-dependent receptor [Candidatus Eisenbacteria bacterium]
MRMGLSGERLSRAGVARISCIWVLIAGVATGSLAFADVEDLPVFYLGEVVVTSDRIPKEGPTTISEVAAGDIQRQNATNLGEALKLVPSLHFHQARCKAGFYGTLRGFEQEGVLVLLDGIPIGVPYEALVNLPDIPSENIAKIKVVKGTPSLLYGPNALGGVINVITKRGEETPSGSFSYQISDYNTHHIEVSHGWKLGPLSYRFGLSHRESDGYTMADDFELPENVISSMESSPARPGTLPNVPIAPDGGRRANSDYERDAFTLTSSIDLGSNNTLAMALEHYRNVYGVPPIPVLREHKNGFFYFPRYWRFTNWKRFTVNVIEESRPTSSLRIKTRLFYDQYENTLDAYDGPTLNTQDRQGPPSGTSVYDDYSRGGKLHVFWHGLPRNELRLGIGVVEDVHRGTFLDDPTDRFVSYTTSIALEDEIRLGRRLAVTAGVSYDMFDKNSRTQEGTGQDPGEDVKTFSPQAGISFDASPSVNLYASVGKRVRFPTMRNLYASGVIGPEGDPDLEEMSTINYELGGTCEVAEDVTAGAALFYSDV